jgi:hypothetical protein
MSPGWESGASRGRLVRRRLRGAPRRPRPAVAASAAT